MGTVTENARIQLVFPPTDAERFLWLDVGRVCINMHPVGHMNTQEFREFCLQWCLNALEVRWRVNTLFPAPYALRPPLVAARDAGVQQVLDTFVGHASLPPLVVPLDRPIVCHRFLSCQVRW